MDSGPVKNLATENIELETWSPLKRDQEYFNKKFLDITAWGITIPKIQGLTLDKVVVELGKKDFSAGLSFVAIS